MSINNFELFAMHAALIARADQLTIDNSAFRSFEELLTAKGEYTPSLNRGRVDARTLADLYDDAQRARGDGRRAHRFGNPTRAGTIIDPVLYDEAENWYAHGYTRAYWDRHTMHWIVYTVDGDGHQEGAADWYPNSDSLLLTIYG